MRKSSLLEKLFLIKLCKRNLKEGVKEKAEAEPNADKKAAHLLGFKLGAEAIIAIGNKLVEAGTILLEE